MIKNLIELAKKENIEIEVYKEKNQNTVIEVFNDTIDQFEISDDACYKIKALIEDKTVLIQSDTLDDPAKILFLLKENAKLLDHHDQDQFAANFSYEPKELEEEKYSTTEIIDFFLNLQQLKKTYPKLTSITSSYSRNIWESELHNSRGVLLKDKNQSIYIDAAIVIEEHGIMETGYFLHYARVFDPKVFKTELIQTIEQTLEKIQAPSIPTGKYDIVLKNEAVFSILSTFSDMFSAQKIRKQHSVLRNHLNQKVFSEKITIIEDPQNVDFPNRRGFDTEGTPTQYKKIVDKGVFQQKLYDNKNAIKEGTTSTGNSYGVLNLYIQKGNCSLPKLITKLKDGVIISQVMGTHAGINCQTGDISLQAEGYLVKDGKVDHAIKQIIISANIFELFTNIIEVGTDLKIKNSMGGAPSLLINNISIAGND